MSDDEENFCFFGKPLEPYDEDSFPKKRPIAVEEQIATDAQGRRRFHGAFTGGFSAGFYNTVGSLEGWLPGEFKSSRQERMDQSETQQKPEDFMDAEDLSEFGIAPLTVRATNDYCTSKKRKKQAFSDGPIPGEPVLHTLLTSGNETIGYLLIKNMALKGRKQHMGEGEEGDTKVYGCEMPKTSCQPDEFEPVVQYDIPAIYKEYLARPKSNTFGLDYKGLNDISGHLNLFEPAKLVISQKNKRKVEISGQAFGVGAFEDDDEDIYVKDDMSKYDFEMTNEKISKAKSASGKNLIFDEFICAKKIMAQTKDIPPLPVIPHSFTGKHKVKKSRFEPINEDIQEESRKNINPLIRAKYLGEEVNESVTISKPISTGPENNKRKTGKTEVVKETPKKDFDASLLVLDRFVSASQSEDLNNILEPVKSTPESMHGTQEMRNAVKMKMFGPLTRIQLDWVPCSVLCKRFNVPEPNTEKQCLVNRKRTRNLIFQHQQNFEENTNYMRPGLSVMQTEMDVSNQKDKENTEKLEEQSFDVPEIQTENENKSIGADITEKLDISENVDLFKSIFLSSDEESEDTVEESDKNEEKINLMKNSVLSDNFLPKIMPRKVGLLSNVDFSIFADARSKIVEKNETDEREIVDNSPLYGPKLPEKNMQSQMNKTIVKEQNSEDEWIEKDAMKHKQKHKKKHKKHKKSKKHK